MPTGYVKKIAKQKGKSVSETEKYWDKAKAAASKYKGQKNYYAVVMSIFKKMMGVKASFGSNSVSNRIAYYTLAKSLEELNDR